MRHSSGLREIEDATFGHQLEPCNRYRLSRAPSCLTGSLDRQQQNLDLIDCKRQRNSASHTSQSSSTCTRRSRSRLTPAKATARQAATPKVGQPLNPKMAEPNSTITKTINRIVIAPQLDEFDGQTVPLSSCSPRTDVTAVASIPSA